MLIGMVLVMRGSTLLRYVIPVMVAADLVITVYLVLEGPIPVSVPLGTPMAYKNIYIHVPIAVSTYIVFLGAVISSILYLWRGDEAYSRLSDSFVKYGLLFGIAVLVTGSAWASESWGSPWNWDPKETSVLLLFLTYLAYFPLKNSISDPERRSRIGAVYAIAAFVMVPLSYLSSRMLAESLHPTTEAIEEFTGGGGRSALLGIRILLLMCIGIGLSVAHARGGLSLGKPGAVLTLIILVAGAGFSIYIASPLASEHYRVVDAIVDDRGFIISVSLSNGEMINFTDPIEPPLEPALTRNGTSTLIGHIVALNNGAIKILYHWSTAFDFLVYTILLSVGIYLAGRGGG